jgi:hypothetical protein
MLKKHFGFVVTALAVLRWTAKAVTTNHDNKGLTR